MIARRGLAVSVLFACGFRIFFLSAAVWAVVLMAAWWTSFALGAPFAGSRPMTWHAHEMLFGVVGAAIAGFLLTAVPNWTGRPRLQGSGLAALWGLWLAARIGALTVDTGLAGLASLAVRLVDLAFFSALALAVAAPILQAGNRRNLVMVVLLIVLFVAALVHAVPETRRGATLFAIDLITIMMAIIGGRITPLFTRNWLERSGRAGPLPAVHPVVDLASLLVLVATLLSGLVTGTSSITGWLAGIAGILHLARLIGWRGWRAASDPLVSVLHLGYLWIPAALLLRAAGLLLPDIPNQAWLHAMGVGAMGTLILGVMARVSLGHTGRPLVLPRGGAWMFVLITIAAAARTLAAVGLIGYGIGLQVSALAWMLAFAGFVILYAPVLMAPRADARPG